MQETIKLITSCLWLPGQQPGRRCTGTGALRFLSLARVVISVSVSGSGERPGDPAAKHMNQVGVGGGTALALPAKEWRDRFALGTWTDVGFLFAPHCVS